MIYQRKFYAAVFFFITIISTMYYLSFWKNKMQSKTSREYSDKDKKSFLRYSENVQVFNNFPKDPEYNRIIFKGAKIVHLDLKGAAPKVSYYRELFPLLSKMGATGLLIEYEDMFPYAGNFSKTISALNAYTLDDIKNINILAKESNLEIIPLVQTFGHLEFLLKLEDFKDLREVSDYPSAICPTKEKTLFLLNEMIDQVIEAHPDLKMFHIGADEVFHLGLCETCTSTMSRYNLSKDTLFLEHVKNIASRITRIYPHITVLMWDDEFRLFSIKDLKSSNIGKYITPVVWKYSKEVYDELGPTLWESYSKVFPNVWIASAFKGATGSNQYISDVTHYVQNHRSWMSIVEDYKNLINFQGIIITGWQRYDHFAVLCELLPLGIPSLAMSMRILLGYNDSPLKSPTEIAKLLHCLQPYGLIGSAFGTPKCSYSGGQVLENVLKLQQLKFEYEQFVEDSRSKGWMSEYNIKYQFSSPEYVELATKSFNNMIAELDQISMDLNQAMYDIYDNYTIEEWKETYINPFRSQIISVLNARDKLLSKDTWPRRPLVFQTENKNEL